MQLEYCQRGGSNYGVDLATINQGILSYFTAAQITISDPESTTNQRGGRCPHPHPHAGKGGRPVRGHRGT